MISHLMLAPLTPTGPFQHTQVGKITVFIGPNSGGKSFALREVIGLSTHASAGNGEIIKGIDFDVLPDEYLNDLFEREFEVLPVNSNDDIRPIHRGKRNQRQVSLEILRKAFKQPNERVNRTDLLSHAGNFLSLSLGGGDRLGLLGDQPIGNLNELPGSSFQKLHRDDAKREKFRQLLFNSFQSYPVFDTTNGSKIHLRWSPVPPPDNDVERSQTNHALRFFSSLPPEKETGDGIRGYAGILATVIADTVPTLIVDEPEAFLHPTMAFALGKQIGEQISATVQKAFFATHSAQFLLGCVQSGQSVTVIRVTFDGTTGVARILPVSDIQKIMRTPLLRSIGVANAMFAKYAIVTEADADMLSETSSSSKCN
jgi:energy-coupling factor transporter ATP-binding protein EcfA2